MPHRRSARKAIGHPRASSAALSLAALQTLVNGIAQLPEVLRLLEAQAQDMKAMRRDVEALCAEHGDGDEWLDARAAARHLGISAGSFDKYRYKTNPKIKGYNLDGKTLYKKSDLDSFVRLYSLKSAGLA